MATTLQLVAITASVKRLVVEGRELLKCLLLYEQFMQSVNRNLGQKINLNVRVGVIHAENLLGENIFVEL